MQSTKSTNSTGPGRVTINGPTDNSRGGYNGAERAGESAAPLSSLPSHPMQWFPNAVSL